MEGATVVPNRIVVNAQAFCWTPPTLHTVWCTSDANGITFGKVRPAVTYSIGAGHRDSAIPGMEGAVARTRRGYVAR